jgi:hypothetical protein
VIGVSNSRHSLPSTFEICVKVFFLKGCNMCPPF